MIVVDANVLVYWAAQCPQTDLVEQLRARDSDWRTSPLWRYEFTSAMVMMVRAKMLSEAAALDAIGKADMFMRSREHSVAQADVVRVADRYAISAYDAQYIALAQALSATCVTADVPLARKTPGISMLLADIDRLGTPQDL